PFHIRAIRASTQSRRQRFFLRALELLVVEVLVDAGTVDELGVRADVYDLALVHHDDAVGVHDGGEAVGDDEVGVTATRASTRASFPAPVGHVWTRARSG